MAVSPMLCGHRLTDTDGTPLNGAKVHVYAAGTTTPLSLYTDSGLSSGAANPMVCDGNGAVPQRFMATATYKLVVVTSADAAVTGYNGDYIDPGVAVGSGALPIANGGTGATTAANARTNLGAADASALAAIESDLSDLVAWTGLDSTSFSRVAAGTTAQRPASSVAGRIRYNSSTGRVEYDTGSVWRNLPYSGSVLRTDLVAGFGTIMLGRETATITATTTISATTPNDDTIPQVGEGSQIGSISYTPVSDSSVIRMSAVVFGQQSGANEVILHFHIDGASDAEAAAASGNAYGPYHLAHEYDSTDTSAHTFTLRAGTTAGNLLLNNGSAGNLGAVTRSYFVVEEFLAI
jgi:hypothetical protein